jgi:hypothetical protein
VSDAAYIDSSVLVAIELGESSGPALAPVLDRFTTLLSSNLLEAELRSAFLREGVRAEPMALSQISWVLPSRPLSAEIERVLGAGYVRGADLWHLAAALYAAPDPVELAFISLDEPQRKVAAQLGFAVLPAGPRVRSKGSART